MKNLKDQSEKHEKKNGNGIVAVGIDKDKGSQNALKWAAEHLLARGSTVVLIHVKVKGTSHQASWSWTNSSADKGSLPHKDSDGLTEEIFHPCHVFCARKGIQCKNVILEDTDVARALIEHAFRTAIEHLVLGLSNKNGLFRKFKVADIPGTVAKGAPDFCSVYVVAKEKIQTMRSASRPAPAISLPSKHNQASIKSNLAETKMPLTNHAHEKLSTGVKSKLEDETESFRSPVTGRNLNSKSHKENPLPGMSSPGVALSSEIDGNYSFELLQNRRGSIDISSPLESFSSDGNGLLTPHVTDDMEAEMRRLKLELKRTMEMYSIACKEALVAQQETVELQRWKRKEERKVEEAKLVGEAVLEVAEKEMANAKAAKEVVEAHRRIEDLEAKRRGVVEIKALKESEEKTKALDAFTNRDIGYRRYSIEEIEAATEFFTDSLKIGEGGYGPVYRCHLDHTPVAVKVLRPDAAQGRSQFQREVEVLSCIRHPNMVLLLGACPEYGCLVYDYMANGSLEDRLFRRGNTPSLPWQIRFKIAVEISTGLLFLHQRKPEPLVHRDLKPANILLDSNYVAKIGDVGLARLVPPSLAGSTTQYQMTSTAGTFCYIDPEYQQTGMLGVKSDIYSLGIIFLQILTAKPPMGLTHHVERAIEKRAFAQILDPTVPDWPVEEALSLANMALQCSQLRRKDRPDLAKVVLPELHKLRNLAEKINCLAP
ncbi:U-box domain-containing protein 35-like isoform X2 [Prosopis cineraria]|uniref:U-box domain-containing protein 35-like isoform X2 n=1 Tax=Prosopis cineraria TaxID=364024 RepID=UPI00240FF834|nr:U-box domain-containing protein 35-like isoform X2 [Prosopis cineraria]